MARSRPISLASVGVVSLVLPALGLLTVSTSTWSAQSSAPPNRVLIRAGYDSNGGAWSVSAGGDEPLLVGGPKTFRPGLRSRVNFTGLRATIDGNTLWMSDGSSRVVSVALADGATQELHLPLPRITEIVTGGGIVFAAFNDDRADRVLRFDPLTKTGERIFEAQVPNTFLTMATGPTHLWIATWTGLGARRVRVDLTGIPLSKASKELPRRVIREVDWAAERWPGFAIREDDSGNVWLAHTYAGRVERVDPSGVWTSWPFSPERLVALVPVGSRALALVAAMAPPDPLAPPQFGQTNRSQSVVVIDPASKDLARTNLAPGTRVESLDRAGGRTWIAQGREVKIVGGRAVVNELE